MLAVNDRLGYRPAGSTWSMRRGSGLDKLDHPNLDHPS
jgi:hypothetical protein